MEKNAKMEGKIDKMYKMVECLSKDMQDVKRVLKGDDYGAKGLVESHKNLKQDFGNVKEDVKKAKIVGTVVAAVLGFFGSIIAIFRD
ncbi:hypothetical protein CMI37_37130 [Candidatus Pacearchaeota archaeon]|jgi:hypothetical protein|nr:hypothetical protein [Candidatus Pacearchaeota archaeon]|tara:strand:+ start:1505 stop:1765 length:261 start_codon:yes stop_codon:yes gene_type:complete